METTVTIDELSSDFGFASHGIRSEIATMKRLAKRLRDLGYATQAARIEDGLYAAAEGVRTVEDVIDRLWSETY